MRNGSGVSHSRSYSVGIGVTDWLVDIVEYVAKFAAGDKMKDDDEDDEDDEVSPRLISAVRVS